MKNETIKQRIERMAQEYSLSLVGPCAPQCQGDPLCEREQARREFAIAFEIGARAMAVLAGVPVTSLPVADSKELVHQWCEGFGVPC